MPTPVLLESPPAPPEDMLSRMIGGDLLSHAIGVVACLGVADELVHGTRTAAQLAKVVGAEPASLDRIMRYLSACQIFDDLGDGRYGLSAVSTVLREDVEGSLAGWARVRHGLAGPLAAGMTHAVKTGGCAFEYVYKASFYEYLAGHPDLEIPWNAALVSRARLVGAALAELVNWDEVSTMVDVGGHTGSVLATVLRRRAIAGTVLDQPHVAAGAEVELERVGLGQQTTVVGGDFFVTIPAGADLYLLANVICDWPDDQARTILSNCREAMSASARLVIFEAVMPNGPGLHPAKQADFVQFTLFGGEIRTRPSWNALLHTSGLRLANLRPAGSQGSVIEATVR